MFMACSFGGVGAIPPRDSVTSIRVGLAPARIRYLSRRFQSPWKIANVVVGINVVNSVSESWTGIGGGAGFCATVFIRRWPHMKHGDAYSRITLLQIVQEVRSTCKTRNHLFLNHPNCRQHAGRAALDGAKVFR